MSLWTGILERSSRPRTAPSWRSAAPLIVYMSAYAALWWGLEFFDVLLFTASRPMLIGLWSLAAAAMVWAWWMHLVAGSGLATWRAPAALLLRLALIGLFIMVLADPRAVRKNQTLSVVYAMDMSDSIGTQTSDAALGFVIKTAGTKPNKDEAGLVVFARTAAVELPARPAFPLGTTNTRGDDTINSRVERDGTNLEKALTLAVAMLPEENQARVVLISDGVQTEGSLQRAIEDLQSRGVAVDVLPVQYQYSDEVWLERIELPRVVKAGETYEAAVILSSLTAGEGELVLQENGQVIHRGQVKYGVGKSRYTIPIYLRESGYYEYTATVEPAKAADGKPRDTWARNNKAVGSLFLRGEGRVLLVTDPGGDQRDWEPIVLAMKQARAGVEIRNGFEFPREKMALLPYDCIVFVNVAADVFDIAQLKAAHDAVKDLGAGFIMVGGKNSFGAGAYNRTPIEDALPVLMDVTQRKILPKAALAIVLHTCEFDQGNTWGRNITKQAIRVLNSQDEACVVYYDWQGGMTGETYAFKMTPVSKYDWMATQINNASIGDMPSFDRIMRLGHDELVKSDAGTKHMIIISDGDPAPATPALIQSFIDRKITISTVAIGPHGNVPAMQSFAMMTGGRHYNPTDPKMLPAIFVNEAKSLKRSLIQNTTFTPRQMFPSDILKGIDRVPPLHGYVLTSPKPKATTVLRGPATEEEDIDPVLATWRYGLGKTAAWTSDLSLNWGKDWVDWDRYRAFVKQLLVDTARVENLANLRMQTYSEGGKAVIQVEDHAQESALLQVQARVDGPDGTSQMVTLKQTAPRRYEGTFDVSAEGRYEIMAGASGGGRSERVPGLFTLPYSQEYLRFRSNPIAMEQIAAKTNGRILTPETTGKEIFDVPRVTRKSSRPIMDWFLIALACLVPLDVGLRRVQLDFSMLRAWLLPTRARAGGEQVMSGLKARKQQTQENMAASKDEDQSRPLSSLRRGAGTIDSIEIPPDGSTPKPAAPVENIPRPAQVPDATTTNRLLAAKRRASGQPKKDEPS